MPTNPPKRPTPRTLFSYSRLRTFHQCPARYRLRYLKGLPEAFRSAESVLGNAVHDSLQWLYEERMAGPSPPVDALLGRFGHHWEEALAADDVAVVRLSDTLDGFLRAGREMLLGFHRDVYVHDVSETLSLEQRLNLRLEDGITFTGFADRIGRTRTGRLFVVDYKTSRRAGTAEEFSEGLQAPLYATCALRRHGGEDAVAGYHYLRLGTTSWHRVTPESGERLVGRVLQLARAALAATAFEPRPGTLCAWCGFNAVCEAARVPDDLAGGLRLACRRTA